MLSKNKLEQVAIANVIIAALTIPTLILTLISADGDSALVMIRSLITIVLTILGIYTIFMFKKFLNVRASFYELNILIDLIIRVSIFGAVIGVLSNFSANENKLLITINVLLLIFSGILSIIYGIKLKNCPDDMYGHLKLLANMYIATGVLMASIILVPISFITSIISSILMAQIFFKATKDPAFNNNLD